MDRRHAVRTGVRLLFAVAATGSGFLLFDPSLIAEADVSGPGCGAHITNQDGVPVDVAGVDSQDSSTAIPVTPDQTVSDAPAAPAPVAALRLPRTPWRPHLSVSAIAGGVVGAVGVLVLLQEYGRIFPTTVRTKPARGWLRTWEPRRLRHCRRLPPRVRLWR